MMTYITQWDHALFVLINQRWAASWLDPVMIFASHKLSWLPLYVIIIYLLWKKHGMKRSLVMVFLLLLAFGISDSFSSRFMKPVFQRKRPFLIESLHARLPDGPAHSRYGFVSSHAANFFAITTLSILFLGYGRRAYLILHGIAALVAYSRVYLGVHFPADVFAGAVIGALVAYLLAFLYRRYIAVKL